MCHTKGEGARQRELEGVSSMLSTKQPVVAKSLCDSAGKCVCVCVGMWVLNVLVWLGQKAI